MPGVDGEIFNVVDDELLTARQFLARYKAKLERSSVRIPYFAAQLLCFFWERYSRWTKGQLPPVFNRRRCAAEWKGNRYSNQKLQERLGWKPRVPMEQAMAAFLAQFEPEIEGREQRAEIRDQRSGIRDNIVAP